MTPCHEWGGYYTKDGYGETRVDRRKVLVHRLEWTKHYGPIPHDKVVRHKCDNPKCFNIEHLELGTTQDNTADRVSRGRSAKGEDNGNAILTIDIVNEIRESSMSQRKIAKTYGVSQSTVSKIKRNVTWRS